ncbi:SH3 domain-containing protein, partial [Roseomonas sp. ACRSG]|nr:SH3 domain-containing protein [Roseomonas sp. ACRSG]
PRGPAGAPRRPPPPRPAGCRRPDPRSPWGVAPWPARAAASGTVTTTSAHPVNVRSSPAGGGAVVRVVPRASLLRVFGEAPGGWLQVGEEQPIGWLHRSMLER